MKGLLALLLACLALAPLARSANAQSDGCSRYIPDDTCLLLNHIVECIYQPPTQIPDCLGIKGSFCMSFHVGAVQVSLPHVTRERIQFPGVGSEFMISPNVQPTRSSQGRGMLDDVGFGVFTIDINSDARTC